MQSLKPVIYKGWCWGEELGGAMSNRLKGGVLSEG